MESWGGMYIVCLNVINLTKMAWMVIHFLSLVDVLVEGGAGGASMGGLAFWEFAALEIVIFLVDLWC